MVNKRAYKVASTTTIAAVSDYDDQTPFNKVSVVNTTDGDVEVYFGQQTNPQLIVPYQSELAFDGFTVQGQAYVRNLTGTGGDVYLHVWRHDVPGQ